MLECEKKVACRKEMLTLVDVNLRSVFDMVVESCSFYEVFSKVVFNNIVV